MDIGEVGDPEEGTRTTEKKVRIWKSAEKFPPVWVSEDSEDY